jgi:hypothetical protein
VRAGGAFELDGGFGGVVLAFALVEVGLVEEPLGFGVLERNGAFDVEAPKSAVLDKHQDAVGVLESVLVGGVDDEGFIVVGQDLDEGEFFGRI